MPMTYTEYQEFSRNIRERAERCKNLILADARRTCKAAGLSPDLLGIHPHNAMVSFRAGQPWRGVDYSLCRRTLWLIERSYEPSRLASRIVDRAWRKVCS